MNFYKNLIGGTEIKLRKYKNCFKAKIPLNKSKIKVNTYKNLKLMIRQFY